MPINITMPALSPTMEEGTLAKWLVKPGDTVESGDIIAEIETDKATMEVEAVDEGTVAKILVEEGSEGVKVNAVIAVLAEEGEDASSIEAPAANGANGAAAKTTSTEDIDKVDPPSAASPAPTGTAGTAQSAPEIRADTPLPSAGQGDDRIKASPLARRIAAMKGIDLTALAGTGSGPRGRIVKKDVEAAQPGAAPAQVAPQPSASREVAVVSSGSLIQPAELDERI
ncbi:MAG: biotin/lipoyl-containing protein, partial [Pseudomonadota bacterium]